MREPSTALANPNDDSVFRALDAELKAYNELGYRKPLDERHAARWRRVHGSKSHRGRLIDARGRIDRHAVRAFRARQALISDTPKRKIRRRDLIRADVRAERRILLDCLSILESTPGAIELLRRYPSPSVGQPSNFNYRGLTYTHRWFKTIHLVTLLRKHLVDRLPPDFIAIDIGSGYGGFSGLAKQVCPSSTHVLVELPGQLLLTSYYLRSHLPSARIASICDFRNMRVIPREFLCDYDFVLLPPEVYERLEPSAADLVTSFAALGELKRALFESYVQSEVFRTARFFFTVNPFVSADMVPDSDVTLLDYPIHNDAKRILFRVSPAFVYAYTPGRRRSWLRYEIKRFPPFFEYIGEL